ncbi:TPA: hypothetical protein HA228_00745 [Candidatus Woesearchaeota archaeon]|nr:hypothetical protein [Candidatus Woesearchaeota archaeon]
MVPSYLLGSANFPPSIMQLALKIVFHLKEAFFFLLKDKWRRIKFHKVLIRLKILKKTENESMLINNLPSSSGSDWRSGMVPMAYRAPLPPAITTRPQPRYHKKQTTEVTRWKSSRDSLPMPCWRC